MPDDRVTVVITADASSLKSETAAASKSVQDSFAGMRLSAEQARQVFKGVGESAAVQSQRFAEMTGATKTAATAIGASGVAAKSATEAHEGLRLATAGTTREFLIAGHEILTGNFSRLPGTVMVAMERMGALHQIIQSITPTMYGAGAAALAFGAGVFAIVKNAMEAEKELRALQGSMLLIGRGTDLAAAQKQVSGLVSDFDLSRAEAAKVVTTIQGIPRATDEARAKYEKFAVAMAATSGGRFDAPKAAEMLAKALEGGASGIEKFGELYNLFEADQIKALRTAQDSTQRQSILLDGLAARFKITLDYARGLAGAIQTARTALGFGAETPFAAGAPKVPVLATGPAPDEGRLRLLEIEERYNRDLLREQQLKADIATLDNAAAATSGAQRERLITESKKAQQELESLHKGDETARLAAVKAVEDALAENFSRQMEMLKVEEAEQSKADAASKKVAEDETRALEGQYRGIMRVIEANRQKNAESIREAQRADREMQRELESVFRPIGRAWDEIVSGMARGTETFGQIAAHAFQSMAISFAEAVTKMVAQWLAFEALTAAGWGQMAGAVGSPFAPGAVGLGGFIGAIFGAGAAASPEAGLLAGGMIALDSGTMSVPRDMLALVHQGEIVVPPGMSSAIRSGQASLGGGGGGIASFGLTVNALDARSVSALLNNDGVMRALAARLGRYTARNPSLQGAY